MALAVILMKAFEGINPGVVIGGERFCDFGYADDAALITENQSTLCLLMTKVKEYSEDFGLSINFLKA